MRTDMSKVIVERPRPGSSRRGGRRFGRIDVKHVEAHEDWHDPLPARIGHKRLIAYGRDRKHLNENLQPLRRFLATQVGRPWNKVWSDISAHVRADNTVQQHVRDHIADFVAYRTHLKQGRIHFTPRHGPPLPLIDDGTVRFHRSPEFYVDPRSGLLRRNTSVRSYRTERRKAEAMRQKTLAERMRVIDDKRQLHLLADGNWWEVGLAKWPKVRVQSPSGTSYDTLGAAEDVVLRAGLSALEPSELYGRGDVYARTKRPLSAKEIRAAGLRA